MSLRYRLSATFTLLALIVVLVASLAVKSLSDANDRFTQFVQSANMRAGLAAMVCGDVDERAIAVRNLIFVSRPEDTELEKSKLLKAHARLGEDLKKLKALVSEAKDADRQERSLVAEMDSVEQAYKPVALAITELSLNARKDEATAKLVAECRPLLSRLEDLTRQYADLTLTHSHDMVLDSGVAYASQRWLLIAACIFSVVVAICAGLWLAASITRPIDTAVRLATAVASGDLTLEVDSRGSDEIARLLQALAGMGQSLRVLVEKVRHTSDSIATGSSQIASGNADLSHRTEEQASTLQETAASMEHLNATVKQNADHARQADQLARGASEVALRGGSVVSEVVTTMAAINDSSRKISEIVSVIDGIAFQTNILALNAAVEAARAGEHGRGFAVVATEVRNLAGRCSAAAKEIKAMITDSVARVSEGATLVNRAGVTMTEVVQSIQRVTDIVSEISSASQEQSSGVSQVGLAITQMDHVTQQNAALVEQSAAAAESLMQQAKQLVQTVAVFRVG